jgi:hypothetical protein
MNPAFIKIWVDDHAGRTKKLTPEMYLAIIDERTSTMFQSQYIRHIGGCQLMRAGVEGWLHVPVRGGEAPEK